MSTTISWVCETPGHPVHYVRCLAPVFYGAQNLYSAGIKVIQGYIPDADTYVFQRPFKASLPLIKQAKTNGHVVLFDFDDPLWLIARDENRNQVGTEYTKNLVECIKYCDGIICSTEPLADSLKQHVYSKLIKQCKPHIPNLPPIVVFTNAAQPCPTPTSHDLTIFWGGCGNSKLAQVDNAWIEALKVKAAEGFKIVSAVDIPIPQEKFEVTNWANFLSSVASYRPLYYVAPLKDNPEAQCKSDLKELEAWRLGAKFVGQGPCYSNGLPFNATKQEILNAFDTATIPHFDATRDMGSLTYTEYWATIYTGEWLTQLGRIN